MKIQFRQIENFVKSPDKRARAILVYGSDSGLVSERCSMIGRTIVDDLKDPFNVALLDVDKLLEDPARLADEASAISMMGGDRLIRIEGGSDKLTVILKSYLENPSDNALIIVQAGELSPRSSLRKLCESAKNAAALPCYVEDERGVANIIREAIRFENKTIDQDAISWLCTNISGDRAKIRSELEKLVVYKGNDLSPISLSDVKSACGGADQQDFDNFIYAVASKKTEDALKAYNILMQEGTAFIAILRSLQNHFRRLHIVKSYMHSGMDIETSMKKLTPPVFFKQAPIFKVQIHNWSLSTLDIVIRKLTDLEVQCKRTAMPVEILCSQAILAITKTRTG